MQDSWAMISSNFSYFEMLEPTIKETRCLFGMILYDLDTFKRFVDHDSLEAL